MPRYYAPQRLVVDYGSFVWPERRLQHTYCAYCRRQHRDGLTSCEGCGAPVTAPGRIDALQAHLDEFDRVEVTTFGDSYPKYIDIPKRAALSSGVLSVNEVRAMEGIEPPPPPPHMVRR